MADFKMVYGKLVKDMAFVRMILVLKVEMDEENTSIHFSRNLLDKQ